MSYHFAIDRKLNALGYLLLVYALKREGYFHALPEFGFRAGGKPFLVNYPGIHFNLSHCKDAVACILSSCEVGVDVESVCPYDDNLARAISNDTEYGWINEHPDPVQKAHRFTELWTRKESLVKWLGTGLNDDLPNIFSNTQPHSPGDGYQMHTHFDPRGKYYLSTCMTC